ncbi:glycoside hydrolase family 2 protein [Micromonospora coxensis]|uniref:Beta-glucuronidase n=1 Tax=Micromonospora coxensis TaxID=356852 RepID=A0A1C5GYV0_9ACTN|nr:glycoside hydrolase family 2 TIM barrel-domain containing protein [Micromonospora coxensis]SCG38982.1 beta-glucuronidase [Micromonospora coxensis]
MNLPVRATRRTVLAATAATAATAALPGLTSVAAAAPAGSAHVPVAPVPAVPPHGGREPAGTRIEQIAGTGVVLQYGRVVPSFDGWDRREPTRDYRSLDGRWHFRFDPADEGFNAGWHQPGTGTSGWDSVTVPSSWDLENTPEFGSYSGERFGEGTAFQDGYAWYRTTVRIPANWADRQVRLNFLAVNYKADVWVDGRLIGAHEGGHTPFALPIGDVLTPGATAVIVVRVHRRPSFTDYRTGEGPVSDPLAVPWKPVDYWPYAGITRSVWLEAVPEVSIPKVLVSARDGRLDVRVVVDNRSDREFAGQVVVSPGRKAKAGEVAVPLTVAAGAVAVARVEIAVPDAPTWSCDDPNVLTATAELRTGAPGDRSKRVDQLRTDYGVRTVAVVGSALTVNGVPVFLKGLNWHEETARSGRSMTKQEYDRELKLAREAGANLLRNSVYNRHPYVYQWADRNGVLVMDDIDNMWMNKAQEDIQTRSYGLSRALATMMAWNQHNNPSVILWGLQNESEIDGGGAPVYRAWIKDMKDAVKSVDLQNRPVTWASSSSWDPAFDLADVIGFNEYFGYFYGKDADLGPTLDAVHANHPNKPILITENGTWSFLGNRGSDTEQGTEDWQAASFQAHWAQVTARPEFVAGYTFWVLKDYKQRLGYNEEYNGLSTMGLVGFDSRTRRLVYDAFSDATLPR